MVIPNCATRSMPGRVVGPRILASGRKLITQGSYVQNLNPALADAILQQEFLLIDGADQARQAVRRNAFQNVDVIKVTADENLTVAELAAVIEEAHREHLKVAVHAPDKVSIQTAIDAQADSIEHGNEATDAQLKQMRDKGIFLDLTPTFNDGFYLKIPKPYFIISPASRADAVSRNASRKEHYDQLVQRVLKSGVKFAAGSDMYVGFIRESRAGKRALRPSSSCVMRECGLSMRLLARSPRMRQKCWAGKTASAPSSQESLLIWLASPEIPSPTLANSSASNS